MHSTVYELADHPIPESSYITPGYLPDWFFGSVADYATEMSGAERADSIATLAEHFGSLCNCNGNQLIFSPQLKQDYFKKSHQYFKKAAVALSETDYDVFAGITSATAFHLALNSITESYTDKYSFYIYEDGDLSPLDNWLRSADIATRSTAASGQDSLPVSFRSEHFSLGIIHP